MRIYKVNTGYIMIIVSFLFILNQNNKVYIKKVYVLHRTYYSDNKKSYQINDNLTYNWELFNSRGIKKTTLN